MRAESGGRKRVQASRRHNVASSSGVWRGGQWGNHDPVVGIVTAVAGKERSWLTAHNETPVLLKGNLNSTSRYRPRPAKNSQLSTKQGPAATHMRAGQAWISWDPIVISGVHPPRPFPQPLDAADRSIALRRRVCCCLDPVLNLYS